VSVRLVLSCDGHRRGDRCRGARITGLGYSPTLGWAEHAPHLPEVVAALFAGERPAEAWSRLPNGGDLCPSGAHDEDPAEVTK
jgi:hypothetical protein